MWIVGAKICIIRKTKKACINALPAAKRHIMIVITVNSYLYFARGADTIQERRSRNDKRRNHKRFGIYRRNVFV